MKTHYIFCCNSGCVFKKMREFAKTHKGYSQTIMSSHTILWRGCAYIFIADVNTKIEQIEKLMIESFEVCPDYAISYEVVEAIIEHDSESEE